MTESGPQDAHFYVGTSGKPPLLGKNLRVPKGAIMLRFPAKEPHIPPKKLRMKSLRLRLPRGKYEAAACAIHSF